MQEEPVDAIVVEAPGAAPAVAEEFKADASHQMNRPRLSPFSDEFHREITLEHVNWLLRRCGMKDPAPISSIKQCSSSLFVLVFQRLFGYTIKDLEREPNTPEKKLNNISRVLRELQEKLKMDLSSISAKEIVGQNEEHIANLIRVFLFIAMRNRSPENVDVEPTSDLYGGSLSPGATQQQQQQPVSRESGPIRPFQQQQPLYSMEGRGAMMERMGATNLNGSEILTPPLHGVPQAALYYHHPTGEMHHGGVPAVVYSSGSSESYTKKKDLVSTWFTGVVPPTKEKRWMKSEGYHNDMKALRERIAAMERAGGGRGRTKRPQPHSSREKLETSHLPLQRRTPQGAARDARIEWLRSIRFLEQLQGEVRTVMAHDRSAAENSIRATLKDKLKQQRDEYHDLKKMAREEDEKYRAAYASIVQSARREFETAAQLLDEETRKVAKKHSQALRELRQTAREFSHEHRMQMEQDYRGFLLSLSKWRSNVAWRNS